MAAQNESKSLQEIHDKVAELVEEFDGIHEQNSYYRAPGKKEVVEELSAQMQKYKTHQLNNGKLDDYEPSHEVVMGKSNIIINNYMRIFRMYGECQK
jgi:hypothetical protein